VTLPNALIGGAPKCGTTSLAEALAGHPDIFIPYRKELSFFHADSNYERGLDWYAHFFREGSEKPIRLEATPDYLASAESSRRIRNDLPGCRLIFLIRDPAARAHSHYWFRARSGRESRAFVEALRDEQRSPDDPDCYLIRYGQYAEQLRRYCEAFDREQILVMRFSELTRAPEESLRSVQEFLGLRPLVTALPNSNPASEVRSEVLQHAVRRVTTDRGPMMQTLRTVVPSKFRYRLRQGLKRLNARPVVNPPIEAEAKEILVGVYRPELDQIEALLGVQLDDWRAAWTAKA
jgi:hypothetical protein